MIIDELNKKIADIEILANDKASTIESKVSDLTDGLLMVADAVDIIPEMVDEKITAITKKFSAIKDSVSKVKAQKGDSGRDGIDGLDGLNGRDGKDGSPDKPKDIADKLNTLENVIDPKVIKGSSEYVNRTDLNRTISTLENQTRFLIQSNANKGNGGGAVDSVNGETGVVNLTTDNVPEGTNKYLNSLLVDGTSITGNGLDTPLSANFTQTGKYMISGGASWSGIGLVYDVSFLTYFFNGNKTADPDSVTLAASDPTNPRLDAVVVDEAGVISVITGDPSSSPVEPAIPEDQLQVQFILVEAGSTTPTIATENIYLDDPTSGWTFSTYNTATPTTGSINFAGTNSPKQGIECIEASTDLRLGARFVRGTSFDAFQYTMLQVWVRFTGTAVATNKSLNVRFENSAGTLVANTVNLFNYGLQRGVLNTWQLVVVPLTAFGALPATVKGLKMIMAGGTVGVARQWDIDYMLLTDGSVPFANVPTIAFYKDNVGIASQSGLNIKQGLGGTTITGVNNPTLQTVDYTFNAFGGDTLSYRDPVTKQSLIATDLGPISEGFSDSIVGFYTGILRDVFVGSGSYIEDPEDDTNFAVTISLVGSDGKPNGSISGGVRGNGAFSGLAESGQYDSTFNKPYFQYTSQIAGQGGGLDFRNLILGNAAGLRLRTDGLFVLDASQGFIRLRQTSSSTNFWDLPVIAGADGYKLTSHGDGQPATWEPASGGGVSDGDYGDITVSGTGSIWTVDNSAITYAKIQNLAQYYGIGRIVAGTGVTTAVPILSIDTTDSNIFSGAIGAGVALTATSGIRNNLLGFEAGSTLTTGNNNNFLGYQAGKGATTGVTHANFLGYQAGLNATSATNSNFFGRQAGSGATSASFANFFGRSAGLNATGAQYGVFIGDSAGNTASGSSNAIFIGQNAGYQATTAPYTIAIGTSAGYQATGATTATFIGYAAGYTASDADYANMIGRGAGNAATNAQYSNFMGFQAGYNATNAKNSIFIGQNAGFGDTVNNTVSGSSILIGESTSTGGFQNSIAIGKSATNTAANEMQIGSSTSKINTLVVNGTGGIQVPVGTTGERVAVQGMIRYNTTTSKFEGYDGAVWQDFY